jgi:hypothetical protein
MRVKEVRTEVEEGEMRERGEKVEGKKERKRGVFVRGKGRCAE